MNKKKILIISLDGGDWRFLEWANQYYPLKNIFGFKTRATLESTVPAITPAAWASFQTGLNPGETGVYDFSYWDRDKREKRIISTNLLPKTIWQRLSSKGKSVGLVNVPLTYPPKKINGTVISGILTPSMESGFSYPRELKPKLLEAVSNYHIFNLSTIKNGQPHKQTEQFLKSMSEIVQNRYQACNYLLNNFQYDLFMVHFQANDVVSHVMWGYLDPDHKMFDKDKAELVAKIFYQKIDQLVGKLVDDFKQSQKVSNPLVLLVSDHGFESHRKRISLGSWLAKQGYLKLDRNYFSKKSFSSRLARKIGLKDKNKPKNYFLWDQSGAFATGRSGEGFIYLLNQSIRKELVKKLRSLIDPEIGEKVIKKVWQKEDLYKGNKLEQMPDLIIEPISGYSCSSTPRKLHERIFSKVDKDKDFHIGKHRKEGILAVNRSLAKDCYSILDIAPTIGYYLKSLEPDDKGRFDGQAIDEIIRD